MKILCTVILAIGSIGLGGMAYDDAAKMGAEGAVFPTMFRFALFMAAGAAMIGTTRQR